MDPTMQRFFQIYDYLKTKKLTLSQMCKITKIAETTIFNLKNNRDGTPHESTQNRINAAWNQLFGGTPGLSEKAARYSRNHQVMEAKLTTVELVDYCLQVRDDLELKVSSSENSLDVALYHALLGQIIYTLSNKSTNIDEKTRKSYNASALSYYEQATEILPLCEVDQQTKDHYADRWLPSISSIRSNSVPKERRLDCPVLREQILEDKVIERFIAACDREPWRAGIVRAGLLTASLVEDDRAYSHFWPMLSQISGYEDPHRSPVKNQSPISEEIESRYFMQLYQAPNELLL